jgi:hypothetical protein
MPIDFTTRNIVPKWVDDFAPCLQDKCAMWRGGEVRWRVFKETRLLRPRWETMSETIRDIVRRAQDILCDLDYSLACRGIDEYRLAHFPPVAGTYPQTLGELCIEIAQGKITEPHTEYSEGDGWITKITHRYPINKWVRGDIQQLRRAMWHKHRDPEVERFTALAEYYERLYEDGNKALEGRP